MMYKKFLTNANPLGAPEVTSNVQDIIWDASSINLDGKFADPFYLRFVLDGIDRRRIFLHRAETIPHSLDEVLNLCGSLYLITSTFYVIVFYSRWELCAIMEMMNCLQNCSIEMKPICPKSH